jgi:cellulose synthase/poly-beta-1,6-N-acetylglucosamine synthase-like glycosyltransferase
VSFAILIGTYGDQFWADLAQERAVASTDGQGADEVLVRHVPDGKRHEVRNALAADAMSDWLCFLDADDHLAPGFIAAMRRAAPTGVRALLNPAVGHWNEPDNHACFAPKELHTGNYLIIGTLVQRELFLKIGGFWDWDGFEDWELWIRCRKAGAVVVQVPDAVYLIDSTERSRDATASAKETSRWLREIRQYHWPEMYGRPSGKRATRAR